MGAPLKILCLLSAWVFAVVSLAQPTPSFAQSVSRKAQLPKQTRGRGGKVAGLVLDSLHGRPLPNAEVLFEGKRTALVRTDLDGQFSTNVLPVGKYRASISHPFLDSLGISLSSPEFLVIKDSTTFLEVSVPSAPSLIKMLCKGRSSSDSSAAVVGQINSSASQAPIARAEVTLTWVSYGSSASSGSGKTSHIARDTTDSNGRYRLCGLAKDLTGKFETRVAGQLRSISALVIADSERTIAIHNVSVPATGVTDEYTATISGRVELPDGQPARQSSVELVGTARQATADEKGIFILDNVPIGPATVRAKLLGYEPDSVALTVTPTTNHGLVVIKLRATVPVLSTVNVSATARDRALDRVGFTRRSEHSVGHFLTGEQIARKSDFQFTDLLRGIPGLTVGIDKYGEDVVTSSRAGGSILNSTHGCVQYFVDGQPWGNAAMESMGMARPQDSAANRMLAKIAIETARQINAVVKKSDVLGIEVYQGGGAPAYFNQGGHNCATIVIWTVASLGA